MIKSSILYSSYAIFFLKNTHDLRFNVLNGKSACLLVEKSIPFGGSLRRPSSQRHVQRVFSHSVLPITPNHSHLPLSVCEKLAW